MDRKRGVRRLLLKASTSATVRSLVRKINGTMFVNFLDLSLVRKEDVSLSMTFGDGGFFCALEGFAGE